METLFAVLIAMGIGVILRFASGDGRGSYGLLLLPGVSAVVTTVVWEALIWAGWTFDGTWIWVVGLSAGPLVALIVALTLPKRRRRADDALFARLTARSATPPAR